MSLYMYRLLLILLLYPLTTHAEETARWMGSGSCSASSCHGGVTSTNNQYTLWSTQDSHSKAFDVLFSKKSQRMSKILGIEEASKDEFCLKCHGSVVASELQGKKFDLHEGVGCEKCHGASEKWLESHVQKGQTHAENVRLGMTDLSNLHTRAQTCIACHSGLDHRVYSAGHPEITFELDAFSALMPKHWEKKRVWEGARGWVLGQILALDRQLEVLKTHANQGRFDESGMNCVSCHHNLYDVDFDLHEDATGNPSWDAKHWAVLTVYLKEKFPKSEAELNSIFSRLQLGFQKREISPQDLVADIKNAQNTLHDLATQVDSQGWSAALARRLMEKIASQESVYAKSGFKTAEQAVMALDAISQAAQLEVGAKRWISVDIKPLYDVLDVNDPARYQSHLFLEKLAIYRQKLEKAPTLPAGSEVETTDSNRENQVGPSKNLWERAVDSVKGLFH